MEPELECFDAQTHKADGFGELKDGFVLQCSLQMSRLYARFFLLCLLVYDIFHPDYLTLSIFSCHCLDRVFLWKRQWE